MFRNLKENLRNRNYIPKVLRELLYRVGILEEKIGSGGSGGGTEIIDEGNGDGLVIAGRDSANYGNIGLNAVDFGFSELVSSTRGATGALSTIGGGGYHTASGVHSTIGGGRENIASERGSTISGGNNNEASAFYSTITGGGNNFGKGFGSCANCMGNTAASFGEWVGGSFSTEYIPVSDSTWDSSDRIFNIGNGLNDGNRSDAFQILKNGTITAPSLTNTLIDTAGDKALITKEYADAKLAPTPTTVAGLPGSPTLGDRAIVTDALGPIYLAVAVGGGTVTIEVWYDGSNWICK